LSFEKKVCFHASVLVWWTNHGITKLHCHEQEQWDWNWVGDGFWFKMKKNGIEIKRMKNWFNLLCVWYQRISDPMRSFFCLQWQSQDLGQGCKLLNYFSVIFSKQNHGTTYTKLWKNIHHSNYTNSSTSHYLTPQHTPSKHQSLTVHNQ
jgi:hypothetical protein